MSWTLQNIAWADIVASVKAASPDGLVVFDRASTNNTSGTLNWTHVTTNAANRLMLGGVSLGNYGSTSNSAVTALSCGGANLTKVMAITNGIISSELWQLVNPPSCTNTVTLTYAGTPTTVVAGAATFSGVDPATPLSAVNSWLRAQIN